MSKQLKKSKLFIFEIVWYTIGGVITFFGLLLMVFGVIGHFMGGSLDDNFIKAAESSLAKALGGVNLGFSIWGIFFFLLGVSVIIITLAVNAKKADRDIDKASRRQQRLAASSLDIEVKPAVQTIPSEPVEPSIASKQIEDKKVQ